MKIVIPLSLLFGYLFYVTGTGLNLLVMNIACIIALILLAKRNFLSPEILIPSLLSLAFSFSHWLFGTWQTVLFTYLLTGFAFTQFRSPGESLITQLLNFVANGVTVFIRELYKITAAINLTAKKVPAKKKTYVLGPVLIAAVIIVVFFGIYYFSNPVFASTVQKIPIQLPDSYFLLIAILGFVLLMPLVRFFPYQDISALNKYSGTIKDQAGPSSPSVFSLHALFNTVLFTLTGLIVLLGIMHISDLYYLTRNRLPEGVSHAAFLHQGFYSLIISVCLSTLLLVIFFRGKLNFIPRSNLLRRLGMIWILMNFLLLVIVAWKNAHYVTDYGLTQYRLLVFLAVASLIPLLWISIRKLQYQRTGFWLIQKGFFYGCTIIAFACIFPWSRVITWYNLQYMEEPDHEYLLELTPYNLDQLITYAHTHPFEMTVTEDSLIEMQSDYLSRFDDDWRNYSFFREKIKHTY